MADETNTRRKANPLGPTGKRVAQNVTELRGGLSYAELSRRLDDLGRPIPVLGLHRIERKERRVDADDLVALAVALEVTPNRLLFPATARDDVGVSITDEVRLSEHTAWRWAQGQRPAVHDARIVVPQLYGEADDDSPEMTIGGCTERLRRWFDDNALPRELKRGQEPAPIATARDLVERLALFLDKPDDDQRREYVSSGLKALTALVEDTLAHPPTGRSDDGR